MSNVADDISHAYQDGFNDGVRSVFSKTGFFLVKDEKVYAVDIPYEFKYQKSVDIMTGKVHYPTNRMRLRGKTDEELAEYFTQFYYDGPKFYCPAVADVGEGACAANYDCRQCWLDWLKQEAKE